MSRIELPGVEVEANINDVFFGRGYNLEYITENFKNTLVLATEVSKIYCNEETGESYPEIIKAIQRRIKRAILNNVQLFVNEETNWAHKREHAAQ